jgi:hypothetical protein
VLLGLGLLVIALSPKWEHATTPAEQMQETAKQSLAKGPPPEPGQGKVTVNLSRAMRLHLPIIAIFTQHVHEHKGGPEQLEHHARERAEHQALAKLAADYKGVAAVVEVSTNASPASVVRAKVMTFPTTIIYGADRRELWRREGEVEMAQIRAQLAALGIKPQPKAAAASGSR